MAQRSPAEIRDSIEANRNGAGASRSSSLRGEVARITDWRGHLERHRREVIVARLSSASSRLLRRRRR